MQNQIGMIIQIGRVTIENDELRSVALGNDGERCGRIDDKRRTDGKEEITGKRGLFRPGHGALGHGLTE